MARSGDRPQQGAGSAGRLQHSQQLRLGLQIAFADFIQKQRAAVGQLEGSLAVAIGSGECTFDMAESAAADNSNRVFESAAQLIATKGRSRRGLAL